MNASMPFSLDHDRSMEDQILLKSALAVVVLRRRALGKARQVRFSGKRQAFHDFTRQSKDKSIESDGKEQVGDQNNKEKYSLHCQSEKSTQELTLFQHHPILAQCRPRGESDQLSLDSYPSGITERSSKFSVSHVESMANLVIPTTIPLYAMYYSHSTVRDDSTTTMTVTAQTETLASPIYDYQNANSPSFHDLDHTKSNKSKIATYGVLDGLLLHLTSQSSFHNRIYSMIMIPVILPVVLGQSGDTFEEKKIMTKILSLCTVLHRFVVLDPTCFEEVMVSICRTLKMLYRHRLDTECVQYRIDRCSNVSSATVGINFNHDTTVKMLDVLAVNMIVLLENIMVLHLKHYGRLTSSTSSMSGHDGKNGMIGSEYVMKILHQELEQLLVPIRIEEMAAFYVRDGRRIHLENQNETCMDDVTDSKAVMCNGLNTGGKLMLRLSLYDIIRKMC
jgi:hypothetical protein